MRTSLGLVEVEEQTYPDRHREIRPLSEVRGITACGYSRRLQRVITDFAADVPFERAAAKTEEHYGVSVPTSSCRSIALAHAACLTSHILPAAPANIADQLIAEADGSMVPIVLIDDEVTGDRRRQRKLVWKEAKLSLVRWPGEISPLVSATFGDPAACGAAWGADQVEGQFGRNARYLVDFLHVCECLALVAAYAGDD